jgi:hypothetical protein
MARALHPTYLLLLLSLKLSRDSLVSFLLHMFIMLQSALDLFFQPFDLFSECLIHQPCQITHSLLSETHGSVLLSVMRS